ncbi:ATP-binding cassette domain-containing protein [Corynebacterium freiburgense]|uniref:ATP-binding cassette domain-containing protein n=1 Tax=Corynebacterium freiburgense TaxID=556548 RepID=UPI000685A776|nr:ATP-binding cassette domain-containing protein [Corynebacterium freiburgense]WJZ02731.1 Daunorubicin/doxorubicin resistance ATP-binding protein DrrA [Corynebacterium freiburgense]
MVQKTHHIIQVDALRRVFPGQDRQDVVAVHNISMNVPPGQTLAILGPNGAGKSTLLRMLTTLLPPTSGTAHIAGLNVIECAHQIRSLIGYVGQGNSAGHSQRALDEVISQARMYGANRTNAAHRAAELFSAFGLTGMEQRKTQEMSGGQRRRLDLAMGLVHHPRLLFLDEPTTGLDPQNRANLWEHIRQIREGTGMTVVLTTHYLEEADAAAERILIIDHGRILADGTAYDLKQTHVGSHVTLTTHTETDARALAAHIRKLPETLNSSVESQTVQIQVQDTRTALPRLITHAAQQGITITQASAHEPTLDDVFLTLTGRKLRDNPSEDNK